MPTAALRLIDALLAGDTDAVDTMLAPDARFSSPIREYDGASEIGAVLRMVAAVVDDVQPTSVHEKDREAAAFFTGSIKGRSVDGVVRALGDESDRVSDLTLMVRPWAALSAGLAELPGVSATGSFVRM